MARPPAVRQAGRVSDVADAEPARGLVLVVEDEAVIADVERRYLSAAGYRVHTAGTAADAWVDLQRLRPVAVVLDVGLPDGDGLDLCRRMRAAGDDTPVLFATARDEDVDRILGLELGGDDYLVKPFNPRELVARVRAVLRRGTGAAAGRVLVAGRVRVDPAARRAWVEPTAAAPGTDPDGGAATAPTGGGREIALTATEFDLLAFLIRQPGRVFERSSLLSAVWGYSAVAGERTVDVHIAALRAKLGDASPIRTVRGVGYGVDRA